MKMFLKADNLRYYGVLQGPAAPNEYRKPPPLSIVSSLQVKFEEKSIEIKFD